MVAPDGERVAPMLAVVSMPHESTATVPAEVC
jgi:hypothetical protein